MLPTTFAAILLVLAQASGAPAPSKAAQERFDACTVHMDALRWPEAAACFSDFSQEFPRSSLADEALYDLALSYDFFPDTAKALRVRRQLSKDYPKSPFAPEALFRVADALDKEAAYEDAATSYTQYARRYPDAAKALLAITRAAELWSGLAEPDKALAANQVFMRDHAKREPQLATRVMMDNARLLGVKGEHAKAAETYMQAAGRAKKQKDLPRRFAALDHAVEQYELAKNTKRARRTRDALIKLYETTPAYDRDLLEIEDLRGVAYAYFAKGDAQYQVFMRATAKPSKRASGAEAKKRVRAKIRAMVKARDHYAAARSVVRTLPTADGEYVEETDVGQRIDYQLGRMAHVLRDDFEKLKLSPTNQARYTGALELGAQTLTEYATARYQAVIADVLQKGRYTDIVPDAVAQLSALDPEQFPPVSGHITTPTYQAPGLQAVGFADLTNNPMADGGPAL
ncbi:MAG: hypothetical protein AAGI01_16125 [Myxococcota bacterium]